MVKIYLWPYIAAIFLGCSVDLNVVMNFSDLTHDMLTIPNVIAMPLLLPVVLRETRSYFKALRNGGFSQ